MEGELPYWMNSLISKLGNHPIYEHLVEDLKPLAKVHSSAWRREMNFQARVWMNHVRELVFDIEDWVEQKPDVGDQLEIEEKVNKFKAQIEQARELYARYNLVKQLPMTNRSFSVLPNERSRLGEQRSSLIALEDQINNIEEHLMNGEMMLTVVSIFGKEGSGKTSLAKEIYQKLQWQFGCQAFVSVGRRASVRTTLLNILRQVKPGANSRHMTSQDLHKVRTELWEYLCTKRYFIVLDGIWSKRAWEVISCALPDKNCGSRVLRTTCMIDVAEYCSVHSIEDFYTTKPLSEGNSKILFRQSLQAGNNWTSDVFHQFSSAVLKICAGLPLAIIVAGGLLSGISEELDGLLGKNYTLEGMTMVLDMSYADLCLPLKSCFLYLSVFSEEHTIEKDRLIWLWRVEGFIPSWEIGECYFNELIIRRLIEAVFTYDDDKAVGCTVHGVIRDYIRSVSRELNFVTVGADLGSGIFPSSSDTVRRLSLDCCNDRAEANILAARTTHLLSMRSLTVFGHTEQRGVSGDSKERDGCSAPTVLEDTEESDCSLDLTVSDGSPVLPCFKLIRVLDLEDAANLRSNHLVGIQGLTLLKYLGLRGTGIDELPGDIGKLEQLEVLDVRQTKMSTLPRSIVGLKRLMRLLLDGVVKMPCNIHEMEGLEEVSTIGPNSIQSFFHQAGVLTLPVRLRVVGVSLPRFHSDSNFDVVSFISVVMGCHHLLSVYFLHLDPIFRIAPRGQTAIHEKVEVRISRPFSSYRLYFIIGNLFDSPITHLHIEVTVLRDRAIYVLSTLPHLVLLKLVSVGKGVPSIFSKGTTPRRCIISTGKFTSLEVLWFGCKAGGTWLQFEPGAMPNVRRLGLSFSAWERLSRYGDFEFGIQHLRGLTQLHATISCEGAKVSEVETAEAAIGRHAGCTTIELRREHQDKMLAGERKSMGFLAKTARRSGFSIWNKK